MTHRRDWIGVGRSETGFVRPTNQDAFAAINGNRIWVVADGMGGHPAGDVAARIAVDTVMRHAARLYHSDQPPPSDLSSTLSDWLIAANQAIETRGEQEPLLRGMGTTIVALGITLYPEPMAHLAHVGDSRAYLYRQDSLTQLTRDHTLVEEYLAQGLIDRHTAKTHPKRHVLTKALGIDMTVQPDRRSISLQPNDSLLLCSDGLTKMLEDEEISAILARSNGDPAQGCDHLIDQALGRGGEDNVTVIVCAASKQ